MKQDPKGQLPGIDLVFADNRTGRIWGTAGVDDMVAGSFAKAQASVRRRAQQEQVFDWQINIQLEHVVTTASRPLMRFILELGDLVREGKIGQRTISVNWSIKKVNISLITLAKEIKKTEEKKAKPHVLVEIIEI